MSMKVQIQNIKPVWKRPNLCPSIKAPTSMHAAFVMPSSLWNYADNTLDTTELQQITLFP
jgi:hypothetical protein